MSLVRFVHTGALRLGSPIMGLTDSPEWLRRIASSAVRQSVVQLFDAALAGGCQFVYVAGRLTERAEDLRPAVNWLACQYERLRLAGIRLVLAGADASEAVELGLADALVMRPGERLLVSSGAAGLRLQVAAAGRVPAGAFSFEATEAGLSGVEGVAECGWLQPLSAQESGGGCLVCELDLQQGAVAVRHSAVQVLRFVREQLNCPDGTTPEQLLQLLQSASRGLAGLRGTTVVEWEIDGRLCADSLSGSRLREVELLRDLRAGLCAGHAGAWPARIRFSDRSELSLSAGVSVLSRELSEAVQRRHLRRQSVESACHPMQGLPLGTGSEVAETLRVLWPAA
ncbi:MAG TPA: hypothetical protein DCR20_14515 [Planctomycetaceae bacterium]|nr:hypothetical protein [Planctomycetaceae bacterium]